MSQHIVNSYDQELLSLTDSIFDMGVLVRDLLKIAERSLGDLDNNYVETAKSTDKKINKHDMQIEQKAIAILALRQPMAVDLRQAVSALKLAVILERMGDLAKNTTKRAARMTIVADQEVINSLHNMTNLILGMIDDVLVGFRTSNATLAMAAAARDVEVDEIYYHLLDKLQNDIAARPQDAGSIMQLIFAIKNIERIGDYVTKIAKIIHYIVTGERITKLSKE